MYSKYMFHILNKYMYVNKLSQKKYEKKILTN